MAGRRARPSRSRDWTEEVRDRFKRARVGGRLCRRERLPQRIDVWWISLGSISNKGAMSTQAVASERRPRYPAAGEELRHAAVQPD